VINDDADAFDGVTTFVTVADALSFRGAASRLRVTPAAVSRTIQRLEERLGVRLFERTTRSVRLTREGAAFAARCREAAAQVRIGRDELHAARRAPQGTLVISASPILGGVVVSATSVLLARYPALRVDLRLTDRLVKFADEDVDVAVRVGAPSDDAVVAHALTPTRWSTVASPAYLARRGTPESVDALAAHDCLRFAPPRGRPRAFSFLSRQEDGAAISFDPRGALDVDHGHLLVFGALAGVGIAQVLAFMVAEDVARGRLVELLGPFAAPGPTLFAVHARRALPRVRAFVDLLREELPRAMRP